MSNWQLHHAKNKFSSVVDAAIAGEPQQVTRRGKPVVAIISIEEFEELQLVRKDASASLPELLLDVPRGGSRPRRLDVHARRVG
ncbi:MAG: type II toxin-antitoxin system Phd/YefM family antitoxin [Gammaproteobacteria bacterium]|nr:type II toxin-antitoxin system Phd/YefM family antitoxin [Gammaproteobacteria bacterium]MCY4199867.1 type II toxin-antitoxin system Phd/YefM family antitoxin [Gammaproteobacteria bacterium]MCY4277704.1 type II toxin-antitoxin system Phd/YefM family antitoxin [Gammaproteobacteria bacterium]MCY4322907.1 type II toxin-antitoxin system Phd/YefM family antitoxin [Gammaproteobacteria bacterium]